VSKKVIVLHLVSHASGELVEMLARNAVGQLTGLKVDRRMWKMVRHLGQVPEILAAVARSPGYVIHSINHTDVRQALEEGCSRLGVPCHFALEPLIGRLAEYSGARVQSSTSSRDPFDEDYYRRIEAMKFTLAHDDGIASDDLDSADVIVVGVSRATKTPTCMYLASRGIKAANVPLVPGIPPPAAVLRARSTLVVGLTIDPGHLSRVRSQRLLALHDDENISYADIEALRREVRDAQRLFIRCGWPIIDVTDGSIEHTAATIIELLKARAETPK